MEALSIIIPAFNIEKYIGVTLNSLLHQVDQDFEIIIVNDGSTDNTLKVVENIMCNSEFRNYKIINQQNSGVSTARNRGLAEAQGKYVYFLDGDDYVSNHMVSIVKKCIEDEDPDIIAWGYDTVREDKAIISHYFDKHNRIESELRMTGIEHYKTYYLIIIKCGYGLVVQHIKKS
jgi:glycosyltransferase involved in cell wall biosynthesis